MLTHTEASLIEICLKRGETIRVKSRYVAWAFEIFPAVTEPESEYTTYQAAINGACLALSAQIPGGIFPVRLGRENAVYCRRDAVVAVLGDVYCDTSDDQSDYQQLKLSYWQGQGMLFVEYGGALKEISLRWSQVLTVAPELLVSCDLPVTCDITYQPATASLDSQPLMRARLEGPGIVRLQTTSFLRLIGTLADHLHSSASAAD
jgi:uncharacterized protein (AIM24 family)